MRDRTIPERDPGPHLVPHDVPQAGRGARFWFPCGHVMLVPLFCQA